MKHVAILAALLLPPTALASTSCGTGSQPVRGRDSGRHSVDGRVENPSHISDLDALVGRVVGAYGGSAAWAKVARMEARGRVVPAMRKGDGAMTRIWRRAGNLRVEIIYPDKTEVRVLEDGEGTNNGRASNAMELDAMRLQAARLVLPRLLTGTKTALRL